MKIATFFAVLSVWFSTCALLISSGLVTVPGMERTTPALAIAFDPCDPIYTGSAPPNETWSGKFGDSDRVRLFYNAAMSRSNDEVLAQIMNRINNDVQTLKSQMNGDLNEQETDSVHAQGQADPNAPGDAG